MKRETLSLTTTALVCALLSGCMVGPKYTRPAAPLAQEFKEATPESFKEMSGWKVAQPSDQTLRGKWWELFNDSQLNVLEEQVDPANQTLKAAEANFRAARANIRFNRANQAPTLPVNPSVRAVPDSTTKPYSNTANTRAGPGSSTLPLDPPPDAC